MKVVALLSGGKDSCYNLVHCVKNGHELVALASLQPADGKEEIDSYIYQTVGQDAIEAVAKAIGLPLVRNVITGLPLEQGSDYGSRERTTHVSGDETEDMYRLLVKVKEKFPAVDAVSVGAILSNYQRVRVEHVCRRLGLSVLAYLWQRDQRELLLEMIDAGVDAILIKVAGAGLKSTHLGQSLAEMQSTLFKLHDQYGTHVCGEGGEYETLTLDCPVYKSRIVLNHVETVHQSTDKFAPVAYLRIKEAVLEKKTPTSGIIAIPPVLDDKMDQILNTIPSNYRNLGEEALAPPSLILEHPLPQAISRKKGKWVSIGNIQAPNASQLSLSEEVEQCFKIVGAQLTKYGLTAQHIAHINLSISSMDNFGDINAIYINMFGRSPPTRACVALDLPSSIRVRLDCLAYAEDPKARDSRYSLHVQGISYWAPANIGPYSQAVSVGRHILVSGQIGLIPAKMAFPSPRSIAEEGALALQHVDHIIAAVKASNSQTGRVIPLVALLWVVSRSGVAITKKGWTMYSEASGWRIPTLVVACKTIPKNGLVEAQLMFHTDELSTEGDAVELKYRYTRGHYASASGASVSWEVVFIGSTSMAVIGLRGSSRTCISHLKASPDVLEVLRDPLSVRLFHKPHLIEDHIMMPMKELFGVKPNSLPITLVPSRLLSMAEEEKLDCAFMIHNVAQG